MKRYGQLASLAVALTLVVAAAGCGGSSSGVKSANKTTVSPVAQVKQNWITFFKGTTPASKKIALLQNGQRFAPAVKAESKAPLANQSAAKVLSVKPTDATHATVRYTVMLAGKPVLSNRTGQAVLENGTWKVGDQSFCALISLSGTKPPGCA
jgi:hypothetical protein